VIAADFAGINWTLRADGTCEEVTLTPDARGDEADAGRSPPDQVRDKVFNFHRIHKWKEKGDEFSESVPQNLPTHEIIIDRAEYCTAGRMCATDGQDTVRQAAEPAIRKKGDKVKQLSDFQNVHHHGH
jgi:hypothetical protein